MMISGKQIQNIMKVYGEQTKVTKVGKPQNAGPVQKNDEVILSSQAQGFGQILNSIKNLPDVREDKVQEISQRIAAGTYQTDSRDIADKMISRVIADRLS